MKMRRLLCQILALTLCALMLFPMTALAEGEDETAQGTQTYAVIDPDALQTLLEDYLTAHNMKKENVSVGYCYLDTGDTWFYNPDTWRYPGYVFQIPLVMLYAEKEYNGELTQESQIKGMSLAQAEENVLVFASADSTHKLMNNLGTDQEVRKMFMAYSDLAEKDYSDDYMKYSYFSARFITDVVKTLYNESERFPGVLDLLKRAEGNKYFRRGLDDTIEVAQKSGNLVDGRGVQYNNTTGVIYTEHPFVLTVMFQNLGVDDNYARDLAALFAEYTEGLNEAYAAWELAQSAQTPETDEPTTDEPATDEPATDEPGTDEPTTDEPVAEAPATNAPNSNAPDDGKPSGEEPKPEAPAAPEQDGRLGGSAANYLRLGVILIAAALFLILLLGEIVQLILRGKKRRDED